MWCKLYSINIINYVISCLNVFTSDAKSWYAFRKQIEDIKRPFLIDVELKKNRKLKVSLDFWNLIFRKSLPHHCEDIQRNLLEQFNKVKTWLSIITEAILFYLLVSIEGMKICNQANSVKGFFYWSIFTLYINATNVRVL